MLLLNAVAATLAALRGSDTSTVWQRTPGGSGTGCAHDSSYNFFVHAGDPRRLLIYLNGGGLLEQSELRSPRTADVP